MITDTPTDSRDTLHGRPGTSNTDKVSLEQLANVYPLSEMYERIQSSQYFNTNTCWSLG